MFNYFLLSLNKIKTIMSKLDKISLFASFVALWVTSFFKEYLQIVIGFILIFMIGILHGSNDIVLSHKTFFKKSNSTVRIIAYYVLIVLLGSLLFYFSPTFGLFLFILVSSYHFGEQHWQFMNNKKNKIEISFFQFTYGLTILMILFNAHDKEVKNIIHSIINYSVDFLNFNFILIALLSVLFILGISLYSKMEVFKDKLLINIFYLGVFTLIFYSASLIWAFAIYFVIWHSLPSIRDQIYFIHGSISNSTVKKYLLTALPFWIISLVGILVLYILLKDTILFESLFFSFLAAITFPHVMIIIEMFKHKKTE